MSGVPNYFQQPQDDGINYLHLVSSGWLIDDVIVSATAAQLNAAAGLAILSNAAFTETWGSAFSPAVVGNLKYTKVGNIVSLTIPAFSGTSVSGSHSIVSVTALPAALRPAVAKNVDVIFNNGSAVVKTKATIGTDGLITINGDLSGAAVAASTAIAVISTEVTYNIL